MDEQIEVVLDELQLTREEIHTLLGKVPTSLDTIAKTTGLSRRLVTRLIRGPKDGDEPNPRKDLPLLRAILSSLLSNGSRKPIARREFSMKDPASDSIDIPVYGAIPAGHAFWLDNPGRVERRIPGSVRETGFFGLEVRGNSMDPILMDGDTVVISPRSLHLGPKEDSPAASAPFMALHKRIVAASVNKEVLLKRLMYHPLPGGDFKLTLSSDNTEYPSVEIRSTDEASIYGVAVRSVRNL